MIGGYICVRRYASRGPRLHLRFVSDYSHHFGGYKARVSAESGPSVLKLRSIDGQEYFVAVIFVI